MKKTNTPGATMGNEAQVRSWSWNGRCYVRQQIGAVVLISSTDMGGEDPQIETYTVDKNGLETFQGYAENSPLATQLRSVY